MNVVGCGFFADQDDGAALAHLHCFIRAECRAADGGSGGCRDTVGYQVQLLERRDIEHRVQQLIELLRLHAADGFLLADQAFGYHLYGNANSGGTGTLSVAGLQHVQGAVFDGEFEVLHVAVMFFQARSDLSQLLVGLGHDLFEIGNRLRSTNAGDDVLALRVDQKFAIEDALACGGVAREADSCGGGVAQVAEHHGLHAGAGADFVRDLLHLAVIRRLGIPPGAEHGVARHGQLLMGILREGLLGHLLDQLFVVGDDGLQVFRR